MLREKEAAKQRKAQAMREVLEAAERLAKEERKNRAKREEQRDCGGGELNMVNPGDREEREKDRSPGRRGAIPTADYPGEKSSVSKDAKEADNHHRESENGQEARLPDDADKPEPRSLQVPVSKDVAIVLSGRLEDPDILNRANLQLVNLVMSPSPRKLDNAGLSSLGLNTIVRNNGGASPRNPRRSSRDASSTMVESRLLTPSKYRLSAGRDFGTQTDVESDVQELRDQLQDASIGDHASNAKDRKDTTNACRRNGVEK